MRRKGQYSLDDSLETENKIPNALPSIPRGHMTGLNTFINDQGRSYGRTAGNGHTLGGSFGSKLGGMRESKMSEDEEDAIPLSPVPAVKVSDNGF